MTEHLDRQQIVDVTIRYASGIDTQDWELFRTCWTEDCVADYGDVGTWQGPDEITEYMRGSHQAFEHTFHRVSNQVVLLYGDTASCRTYVDGLILYADGSGFQVVGTYDDELTRTSDGWRIARRTTRIARLSTVPVPTSP